MLLEYYLSQLENDKRPKYLEKYLECSSLKRLKKIGYFCGMDYASKNIYNFNEYITRFDHSLTVALLVNKLTNDKNMTLAGLFHDISTPCFSHVIDYMNKDYIKQESTEKLTEEILMSDKELINLLKKDNVNASDIINFKQYTVVDNDRPKVCADRIDGVILTSMGWTKNITKNDINSIISDMYISTNEFDEDEISFKKNSVVKKIVEINNTIDTYCHSIEDNYMMELLAEITRVAIKNKIITYNDLYRNNEEYLFRILKNTNNQEIKRLLYNFQNIKKEEIKNIDLPKVKTRDLKPLINGVRIK